MSTIQHGAPMSTRRYGGVRQGLRTIGCFARAVLRQLAGDRSTLFFFLALPVIVIVVVGATFGTAGDTLRIGVVGAEQSRIGAAVVAALDATPGVEVVVADDLGAASQAIRRQSLAAALDLPADLDATVRSGTASIRLLAEPATPSFVLASDVITAAVDRVTRAVDAGRFAARFASVPADDAIMLATALTPTAASIETVAVDVGRPTSVPLSPFSLTAAQNLVLFVFVNSMAGAASLVAMRRTGVLHRVLAGPTSGSLTVGGLAMAWFALAMVQSVIVLVVGSLVFGVDWGDPLGAALVTVAFALVGAGAGLLVGATFEDPDRVSAAGPPIGLVLGALGGCMVPLEVFPPVMRTVALATPHYWAVSAWQSLVFDGAGSADIAVRVTVLTAWAAVLLTVAALRLRRSLTR